MSVRKFMRATLSPGAALVVATTIISTSHASHDSIDKKRIDVNGHTVITGEISTDGRPLAGADILLVAWPNDEELDALGDGDRVNTQIVARDTADNLGNFAVSLDPASISPEHRREDGGVQLELVVADSNYEVFWEFTAEGPSRLLGARNVAWGNARVSQADLGERAARGRGPTHVSVELGARPAVRELGDEPEEWTAEDGARLSISEASERAAVPKEVRRADFDTQDVSPMAQGWCTTNVYETGRTESFVNAIGVVQAKPWVEQTSSSSHALGIAYKSGNGTWSQSGTSSRSTSSSASDHLGYAKRVYNKANYRKYVGCDGNPVNAERWRVSSIHSLNSSSVTISRPTSWVKAANCTTYSNGTKSKTSGSNTTFSSGVNFSKISLSSKASFSSSTKVKWVFTGKAQLCGSSSSGWSGSAQAGAFVL
jgi:hypothetical protein